MRFDSEYKKLNSKQRQAVDLVEGPVMVVAGPGTGKTQVLTMRIGSILKQTDTEPESILAITFTEAGVLAMRQRLASLIGSVAYKVEITTFHSFAHKVIQEFPEYFARILTSHHMSEVEQILSLIHI